MLRVRGRGIKVGNYNNMEGKSMFELVEFPAVQVFMEEPDFHENACLANDPEFLEHMESLGYNPSSLYFVDADWMEMILEKRRKNKDE